MRTNKQTNKNKNRNRDTDRNGNDGVTQKKSKKTVRYRQHGRAKNLIEKNTPSSNINISL